MKELTIEEKAKRYDEAIETARKLNNGEGVPAPPNWTAYEVMFPELKESEDDKIRKALTDYFRWNPDGQLLNEFSNREVYAWLEKQGGITKLSEEEQNIFAKGVLTSCALSFINYLDAHKYEGKMCVSNGECEDIENAFHNAMWDKLHRYYCKYIEKQGEKPQGKSALEAVKEEKVDNQNCVKPVDKVEPKFKVGDKIQYNKYTYIIKEVQEDCYVLDDDKVLTFNAQDVWELVKHNPTEKKPTESEDEPTAWSEDDEEMFKYAIGHFEIQKRNSIEGGLRKTSMQEFIDWIKSLKDRLV